MTGSVPLYPDGPSSTADSARPSPLGVPGGDDQDQRDLLTEGAIWTVLRGQGIPARTT